MDASTSINESLTEERQELMVSSLTDHNNNPIIKTSHFLNPLTATDATLPPRTVNSSSTLSVSFNDWRLPSGKYKLWVTKMSSLHKPTWVKAGIYEAITSSTYRIIKNPSLILTLVQKWCPDTKTFIFPWGEVTLTLEDVNELMGFSVTGSSLFGLSENVETILTMEKQREESTTQASWIKRFENDEIEHEAFLVLWLSIFVFPDQVNGGISRNVFGMAVLLAKGERLALAPAVLASLYNDLDRISVLASTQTVYTKSLFKLVQVWIWERFKSVRPERNVISITEPRMAQWNGVKQKSEGLVVLDGFQWRPYIHPYWVPHRFYGKEGKPVTLNDDSEFVLFARCVRVSKLVGIGIVEDYYPNRVAMQFGFSQDIPGLVGGDKNRKFTEKEVWDDYSRSLNGFKLYIPSCFDTGSVTVRYRDWWMKSIQKETSIDDVSPKILPLNQFLRDETKNKAEDLTDKGHKRALPEEHGNITIAKVMKTKGGSSRHEADKSAMECFQTQDDNITIAQIGEKCSGGVEKTQGEGSRLEADNNNVSVLPQNLACGTKSVAEKEEGDVDERLKQRKARIEEIGLKLEGRMSKAANTLAKIREWKLRRINNQTEGLL